MKRKIFQLCISILASAIIIFGFTLTAGASPGENNEHTPQTVLAKLYSDRFGVTFDEAVHRLKLQNEFPELQPELQENESETFGGLWIQHEPEYNIVIAFTQDGSEMLKKYSEYIPESIKPYIKLVTVKYSLAELLESQKELLLSLTQLGIKKGSGIDIKKNAVKIKIPIKYMEEFIVATNTNKIELPENTIVDFVEALPIPVTDIYGGLTLRKSNNTPWATSGFSVINTATGVTGITTAGHVTEPMYYNGVELDLGGSIYGGSWDVRFYENTGFTVTNEFQWWEDGSTFPVTSTKSHNQQHVGDIVSKYGRVTKYTAGEITDLYAPCAAPINYPTFIEVDNIFSYSKIADNGDSGGPCFSGQIALGTIVARSPDFQKLYYMAINYISALNLSVITN